jgi:Tfp pilus assembly protein PilF
MMRRISAIVLACVLLGGCASDRRTQEAQMAIVLRPVLAATAGCVVKMPDLKPYPGDDVPLSRGVTKSADVLKAEAVFVKAAERESGSKFSAADRLREMGWTAFYKKDLRTAVRRFNQSLLLHDERDEAYDGLARIAWLRDRDGAFAEELYKMAMAHTRTVPEIEIHYAGLLIDLGRPSEALPYLRTAAQEPSPYFQVRPLLVIALDAAHDHKGACVAAAKIMQRDDDDLRKEAARRTAECPKVQ